MKYLMLVLFLFTLTSCKYNFLSESPLLYVSILDESEGRIIYEDRLSEAKDGGYQIEFHRSKFFPGISVTSKNDTKIIKSVFPESFKISINKDMQATDDSKSDDDMWHVSYDLQYVDQMVVVAVSNGQQIERPVVRANKGIKNVSDASTETQSLSISDRHIIQIIMETES